MTKNSQVYAVREGRTEIDFPYKDGKLTVVHPSLGPGTYNQVGNSILESGLAIPTPEQKIAFLHASYFGPEEFTQKDQIKQVRNIMNQRWFWDFAIKGHTKDGVYIILDPNAEGLSMKLDIDKLNGMLKDGIELSNGVKFSGDRNVRFAPKDSYKFGEPTKESLETDRYMIARFDETGAKQAAEISSQFSYSPRIWGVDVKEEGKLEKRVSALCGYSGYWLGVVGDFDDNDDGRAFGVLK